ncbi:NAD(P)-binding protein [Sistotremastrum niveocremeum HHB9708]|uniref:NAD(P)-binding protein n=1 Tax=Sistotremastrum niveocremeum HHB9708 TaxID=1314777 RepID=A0A164MYX2_9AGAM|nr:NAD(P)-binding protein [Sistotremastrum niveocremeum HHB9708]
MQTLWQHAPLASQFHILDISGNNALSLDKVRDPLETNVFSVISMVQVFAPLLVANGGGKILNIGSLNAISPVPLGSAYGVSKAALHQYRNILRAELRPFNIKVITAVTGGVQTNGTANSETFIPSNSLYAPFRESLLEADKKLLDGSSVKSGCVGLGWELGFAGPTFIDFWISDPVFQSFEEELMSSTAEGFTVLIASSKCDTV